MEQNKLTLEILERIETKLDKVISLFEGSKSSSGDNKIDWNAEVEVAAPNLDEYYQLADELYTKLIHNSKSFSDWEYKFISDMYSRSIEKESLSEKQRGWLRKLKEKYL